jgi:DNA-binding NarL/FixJ family response regulator
VEGPISVLFLDTNRGFLSIVVRLLNEYYANDLTVVGSSTSLEETIRQAESLHPRIILVGVGQYSQEGRQMVGYLREALPNTPIILLGTHDLEIYRQAALEAGANAYVSKDNLNRHLVPTIRRLISSDPGFAERMMPEPPRSDAAQA